MENNIFHVDMDCFFCSVEAKKNKNLNNKPFAVCMNVVLSANYLAREYGIKAGMNLKIALQKYPNLIVVNPNHYQYECISSNITNFLKGLVKKTIIGSIDEWFLDLTNSSYQSWTESEFGFYLKSEIKKRFNLPVTIGNSFTFFLAKMATNLAKPGGFLTLTKNNYASKIYHLDVSKIIGVGEYLTNKLHELGLYKIKDVANYDNNLVAIKKLGIIWLNIKNNVTGIINNSVTNNATKSIGRSKFIRNYNSYNQFKNLILSLAKEINTTLNYHDLFFKSLNLKIKLKNNSVTKTYKYTQLVSKINEEIILNLFNKLVLENDYLNVFNVAIKVSNIKPKTEGIQSSLFAQTSVNNDNKLEKIKLAVNQKFNKRIIDYASKK